MVFTVTLLAFLAVVAPQVHGRGYNEGPSANWLGVEQYGSSSAVQLSNSANTLELRGITFGKSGGARFGTWADRQSCTVNGAGYTGRVCTDFAIKDSSYAAAEGVRASNANLYNTVILYGSNQRDSAYRYGEDGQGSSCAVPTTYALQGDPCPAKSGTVAGIDNNRNVYNFPARGLKVTCKPGCGVDGPINRSNWDDLISQLTQTMIDGDWFAARFAVVRLNTNQVLARCRLTSANIGQFGLDTCPDVVLRSGERFNNDLVPVPN
ncbi:Hypothetical protein D9617_23g005990 [Elsinoe fawcettii]|nr:Hypothetical protein D9617_23g005990 [Elsinoe fawcettii]